MNLESKTIQKNYSKVMAVIHRTALELEPRFHLDADDARFYFVLAKYFDKSPESELDDRKGIMLTGTVGTGKTLAMKVMQRLFLTPPVVPCRHIIRDFLSEGNKGGKVIDKYGRESFWKTPVNQNDYSKPIAYCFDDLGLEEISSQVYGNKVNIMAEIILDRYDLMKQYGMITHATTNLAASALEQNYGNRSRDRMREMFNIIDVCGKSKRK